MKNSPPVELGSMSLHGPRSTFSCHVLVFQGALHASVSLGLEISCMSVCVCVRVCVALVQTPALGARQSLVWRVEGGRGQPGTQGALHTLCMRLRVPSLPPLRDVGNAKHSPRRA